MRRGRPRKDGGGDQTDQHIIMQLRKSIILNGQNFVVFRNGDQKQITEFMAMEVCDYYAGLGLQDKFKFQDEISESHDKFIETITEKGIASMGKSRSG